MYILLMTLLRIGKNIEFSGIVNFEVYDKITKIDYMETQFIAYFYRFYSFQITGLRLNILNIF